MIDLHYWPTPNGHKVMIFLEESRLDYTVHPVNIDNGAQFEPSFLSISPNNKIPAIVDRSPPGGGSISLFESGAILLYLAEKEGVFLPTDPAGRAGVLQWLFWQVGGLGPTAGQNHHFNRYAPEPIEYAQNRFITETARLYRVLDQRLGGVEFVGGPQYTIADMAIYPWVYRHDWQGQDLSRFPHIRRWFDTVERRPAVMRAYEIGGLVRAGELS